MTNLRNATAVLALAAGLTALPVIANAQILGGSGNLGGAVGGVTGQAQGSVNGQVGVSGVQDTLGNTTQQVDDAASRARSDVNTVHQQAGDTAQQAEDAAKVDGTVETKGNAKANTHLKNKTDAEANAATGGSVTVMGDPGAVTGAAASGVNNATGDVNTVTGQVGDTVQGAANTATSADLSASAKADAEAKADIEKK